MTLRLSDEQTAKLRAAAERDGVSMHAAVLKAVDDYLDRRTARRDEIIERIFTDRGDLFRRLSDA
jgi:predicted transcriptional regulator